MKKLYVLTFIMLSLVAASASALDLQTARAQNLVTEQGDGYIAAAQSTPEVAALVAEVNAGRKAEYERISKEKGQSIDVVAKLAAEQIKQKLGK